MLPVDGLYSSHFLCELLDSALLSLSFNVIRMGNSHSQPGLAYDISIPSTTAINKTGEFLVRVAYLYPGVLSVIRENVVDLFERGVGGVVCVCMHAHTSCVVFSQILLSRRHQVQL